MTGKRLEIIFWVIYIHYVSFIQGPLSGPRPFKPPDYSNELETELRKAIFTDYEIFQRPWKMVHVNVSLNMLSLNQLNIKDQSLSITAYFTMHWGDNRLSWKKNDTYENIKFLFSNENYMWRPAIVTLLFFFVVGEIDVISKPNIPMRIIKDGSVVWTPVAYLAVILLLQTLLVLLTVIYLDIYFTPEDKPVPEWLRTVTSTFLAKLARVDCRRSKTSVVSELPSNNPDDNGNGVFSAKSDCKVNSVLVKELGQIDEYAERKNEQIRSKLTRPTTDDKQEAWTEYRSDKDTRQDYNWKDIALMMDKITMYLYLLLVTGVTVVCMGIIGYKYTTYHASK